MRAEFERLGRKQLEANVENLVRSKVSSALLAPRTGSSRRSRSTLTLLASSRASSRSSLMLEYSFYPTTSGERSEDLQYVLFSLRRSSQADFLAFDALTFLQHMTLAQKLSTITTKQLFLKHSFTVLCSALLSSFSRSLALRADPRQPHYLRSAHQPAPRSSRSWSRERARQAAMEPFLETLNRGRLPLPSRDRSPSSLPSS